MIRRNTSAVPEIARQLTNKKQAKWEVYLLRVVLNIVGYETFAVRFITFLQLLTLNHCFPVKFTHHFIISFTSHQEIHG